MKILCAPDYSDRPGFDPNNPSEKLIETDLESRISRLRAMQDSILDEVGRVRSEVDADWDRDKLKIVPGSEVLSLLFNHYGIAYRKDRDGAQIASKMSESEIDSEIREMIRQIVR